MVFALRPFHGRGHRHRDCFRTPAARRTARWTHRRLVVPYSKWQSLTAAPLGFTIAFNVTEVCVTEDASARFHRRGVRQRRERLVAAVAGAARVGRDDPDVVGGVGAQTR